MAALIFIFLLVLVAYIAHFYWKVSKYPKGPFPLPFVGNILQFPLDNIHLYFDELSKIYGPVFTVWTPLPSVVLTEYDHVKDAFVKQGDTFTYRSQRPPETLIQAHANTGVLISDGEVWRTQRRTSLKILRDFGMGRNLMEGQVTRSVEALLEHLDSGIPDKNNADIFWPIQLCVGNVINESLFGFHYNYQNSEKFQNFVKILDNHFRVARGAIPLFVSSFSWLRYVPILGDNGYYSIKRNINSYLKFIEDEVSIQMEKYDENSEPETFVHAYLKLMNASDNPLLDKKNMIASVLDFWLAGMETTSNSLRWHIAYAMKYPEVQEKVRKEIMDVVGIGRLPSMADKADMPYTQAVIHEIQRHSNMIPLLLSHECVQDTTILGEKIPAGTNLFAQIYSIMKHDSVFEQPEKFNPERYLLEDGKTFNKAVLERTIPFSIGKRACAGEGLARMELFLIFTALLQKYEFVAASEIDFKPDWGAVLTVKPYKCRLIPQF